MREISRNLEDAFAEVWNRIEHDPAEISRRLARRKLKTFAKTPRAVCLALRAGDTRLDNSRVTPAPRIPDGEEYDPRNPPPPFDPGIGRVHIFKPLLHRLTGPVTFKHPLLIADAANLLGVPPATLYKAASGDPKRRLFKKIDARGRIGIMPYEKDLVRWARENNIGLDSPEAIRKSRGGITNYSFIPHPVPDIEFWPSAGKLSYRAGPVYPHYWEAYIDAVPEDFHQVLNRVRLWSKPNPKRKSGHQRGPYAWLCPTCHQKCRILYCPARLMTLPEYYAINLEPTHLQPAPALTTSPAIPGEASGTPPGEPTRENPPAQILACQTCHNIDSAPVRSNSSSWNTFVAYVSGCLMYGREVPQPAWAPKLHSRGSGADGKWKHFKRTRPAPRRQEIIRQVLEGTPYAQIARQMNIKPSSVRHIFCDYRNEDQPRPHYAPSAKQTEILRRLSSGESPTQLLKSGLFSKTHIYRTARTLTTNSLPP